MKEVMGARRQHEHESGYYEGSDRESVHNMMRQSSSSERIHSSTRSRQNGGCNRYQEDAVVKTQRHQRQTPLHHHSPSSSVKIEPDSHCRRRNGLVQQMNAISVDNDSASVMDVDTVISVESGDTERGEVTPNPQSGCSDTNQAPGEVLRNRSSSVQVVAAYDAPTSPVLGWDLIRTSRIQKKGGSIHFFFVVILSPPQMLFISKARMHFRCMYVCVIHNASIGRITLVCFC